MEVNVLLYSGGLDSYIAYRLLTRGANPKNWQRVYFDMETPYSWREISRLHDQGVTIKTQLSSLGRLATSDGWVPQRNTLLVTMAQAMWNADRVALCGVRGEYSRDKHPEFYRRMSRLLTYTAGKRVRVGSPFARMTKTQAVRAYINAGFPIKDLLETISCYAGENDAYHCGRCASCFRRWVAFENNRIVKDEAWLVKPWRVHRPDSAAKLMKLPLSVIGDFTRAQIDVLTAYRNVWARGE